ncbi:FAD-binding oxidoreductase [Microlunatus soli]|uniref:FAD/FMN-containing dehydrogenase n=1 Tax=Microlunatus soli TaxID=630515 RepID=A0A1H1UTZ1_9ACTN|nr:FAD-binding oxidoreductase [Microlunatus soli]SDS75731.1 FAD/FMN-containing dehydrogenase [Microlunatus soli]
MNHTNKTETQHRADRELAAGFQLRSPHRPRQVVRPRSADETAAAVTVARQHGRRVVVQATGHGRSEGADDVVLISTDRLTDVTIDARQRSARVGAGAIWADVLAATARHGLAPLSGSFPGVGVVGYTLGGGLGLLSRRYGYAADHVCAIELITPDGHQHRVTGDPDEPDVDRELFWGLRGAGTNFGVVTAIEFDLFTEPTVVGGAVAFDLGAEPQILQAWKQWAEQQPEDVLLAATLIPMPDAPGLPPHVRGRHVAQLQVCWPGPSDAGVDAALAELRALGTPLTDTIRELPYAESGSIFAEPDAPHAYRGSGWLLDEPPTRVFGSLPERCGPDADAMCIVGLRRLGGGMAAQPDQPNAIGHRDAGWSLNVLSPQDPDQVGDDGRVGASHRSILEPWQQNIIGRNLNFTFQPLTPDQVAEAYDPADMPRLRRLRETIDPDGILVPNQPL